MALNNVLLLTTAEGRPDNQLVRQLLEQELQRPAQLGLLDGHKHTLRDMAGEHLVLEEALAQHLVHLLLQVGLVDGDHSDELAFLDEVWIFVLLLLMAKNRLLEGINVFKAEALIFDELDLSPNRLVDDMKKLRIAHLVFYTGHKHELCNAAKLIDICAL